MVFVPRWHTRKCLEVHHAGLWIKTLVLSSRKNILSLAYKLFTLGLISCSPAFEVQEHEAGKKIVPTLLFQLFLVTLKAMLLGPFCILANRLRHGSHFGEEVLKSQCTIPNALLVCLDKPRSPRVCLGLT